MSILTPMIAIVAFMFYGDGNTNTTWISINVSTGVQGDAHLISKNNKHILIDTGAYNVADSSLIPKLKKYGVKEIDALIISHPHFDHYGGTLPILRAGIKIKNIYMNMPTPEQMKREWWGGQYQHLIDIQNEAKRRGIKLHTVKKGDIFKFDNFTYLKVLYVFDGINTPVGATDINDMSSIIMLHDHNNKFLFTGDLNRKMGSFLAETAKDLKADILKAPHHGVEGYAPDSFYDAVAAKVLIVPTTKNLWESKRAQRARDYVKEHGMKAFVNGIHGDIKVTSNHEGYVIETENLALTFNAIP